MIDRQYLYDSAKALGISLDDTALQRFDRYAELLVYWNEKINLTAITEPKEIVEKHFIDSLAFLKYIPLGEGCSLIDVGTGAGFPGLALLIAEPKISVTLLDSTKKKLNVIEDILRELELSATLIHMRAEEAGKNPAYREKFDFATARAVTNLRDLSEYCIPFVRENGYFVSLKGAGAREELEGATNAIRILGGKAEDFFDYSLEGCGERAVIKVKKISQTPAKYPRPSAQISKKPLI